MLVPGGAHSHGASNGHSKFLHHLDRPLSLFHMGKVLKITSQQVTLKDLPPESAGQLFFSIFSACVFSCTKDKKHTCSLFFGKNCHTPTTPTKKNAIRK